MTAIRFPTAQELDQGFAAQEAAMLARRLNPLPPAPRDQDERPEPAPRAAEDRVFCQICGRRFDYATKGMAQMQRVLHVKRAHPNTAEAY